MTHDRRDFLKKGISITVAGISASAISNSLFAGSSFANKKNERPSGQDLFSLPPLPYSYDALEPYIDKTTMEIHHSRHHYAYITNLNKALTGFVTDGLAPEDLCKNISKYPAAVRNNGGGHFNHSLFWQLMKPNGNGQATGNLAEAINSSFGSLEEFKTRFNKAAAGVFGSGWAWLVVNKGSLDIGTTSNQDNPLMDISAFKGTPILGLDVWEHAYYLRYQNKRADYINAWWNIVNWEEVFKRFARVDSQ